MSAAGAELGWCSSEVEEELPSLRLLFTEVAVARRTPLTGRSPADVTGRLRELSNRFRGPRAVGIRREPIPAAYRVFYRHIGLDPDVVRTPIEGAILERMLHGGFRTGGLLEDVLLIALVDTSVPVWALDAESVEGRLGVRPSHEEEVLGSGPNGSRLPAGRLVIADSSRALGVLFGEIGDGHAASAETRRLMLFSVQVAGVPSLYVEEALWSCRSALEHP